MPVLYCRACNVVGCLQRQLKACEGELETAKQAVVAAESRSQIVGNAAEHAQVAAASQLQKARERADELKTQLEKAQQEKQAAVSRAEAAEAKAVSKNASAQEAKNSERAFQSSLVSSHTPKIATKTYCIPIQ